jgi:signal transduction histidine kinase/ActR/RegA family two-component response regulator
MMPLLAMLPLAALLVALLAGLRGEQAAAHRAALQRQAMQLAAAVQDEVATGLRLLQVLAGMPALAIDDLPGFRAAAQRLLAAEPGWHSIALEQGGTRRLDLRLPAEAPPIPAPDLAALARVLGTGLPQVSGPRAGLVTLHVPVLRDGAVRMAVVAELPLATLAAALGRPALPEGWAAMLLDAEGQVMASRSTAPREAAHSLPFGEAGWRLALAAPAPGIAGGLPGWAPFAAGLAAVLLGLALSARLAWAAQGREAAALRAQAAELARAAALERRRADLLATVSHELRAPLTGLLGYTELLARADLPTVPRGWVEQQHRAGQSLLALIGDVLDYARLEDGAVALEEADIDLFALLEDCAGLQRALAQQKTLGLRVRIDPGLPRWMRGDSLRLRQVVTNLLSNAIKFTERGEVTLTARMVPQPARIEISVADTGIGIPAAALPHIFDRFQQGAADTARRFGGSGLGLAICRQLVGAMGGTILAESTPGRGSSFTLRVPFRSGSPPAAGARSGPLRILVAEDVAASRLLLVAVLERAGHVVVAAEDGARALAAVHAGRFDLALLDLQMPGLDGYGVAAALRSLPGGAGRMVLVALTAEPAEQVEPACRRAGFDAVLRKPFETRRLLGLVEALGRHPTPGEAPACDTAVGM